MENSKNSSVNLGLDYECTISPDGNLLLHHTKVVKAANEKASTVDTKVKVYIVTRKSGEDRDRRNKPTVSLMASSKKEVPLELTGFGCTAHPE